jgi:hypothetical protein
MYELVSKAQEYEKAQLKDADTLMKRIVDAIPVPRRGAYPEDDIAAALAYLDAYYAGGI